MPSVAVDRFNRTERNRLSALQRRVDWLAQRLAHYRGRDPSHDRAELAALRWVLQMVTEGHLALTLARIIALSRRDPDDPE